MSVLANAPAPAPADQGRADAPPAGRPAALDAASDGVSDAVRRRALGQFFRARRERLAPALAGAPRAGLTDGRRRRTPGLRREEVAERAGVSAAWYTWIEQGRDVRASAATLGRLADALQLGAADRTYLRTLAFGAAADGDGVDGAGASANAHAGVSPAVQAILDALGTVPAYAADLRWDVVAWNAAARRVVYDFVAVPAGERNMVRLMLLDPGLRARLPDWEEEAKGAVALFRATTAGYVGEPWHRAFVDALTRESTVFARWWPALELRAAHGACKVFTHPIAGRLLLAPTTLYVEGAPDLRLVVEQPAAGPEGDDTRARLARFLTSPHRPG